MERTELLEKVFSNLRITEDFLLNLRGYGSKENLSFVKKNQSIEVNFFAKWLGIYDFELVVIENDRPLKKLNDKLDEYVIGDLHEKTIIDIIMKKRNILFIDLYSIIGYKNISGLNNLLREGVIRLIPYNSIIEALGYHIIARNKNDKSNCYQVVCEKYIVSNRDRRQKE